MSFLVRAMEWGANNNIMWWLGHMVGFGQVPLGWETQLDILQLGGLGPRTISILIRKLGNSSVQPMNENHSLDSVSVISSENIFNI